MPHTAPLSVEIRQLTPDAAAQACEVVHQSITHCCVLDHGGDSKVLNAWLANKTEQQFTAWMAAPRAMAWGTYRGNEMVGFALVSHTTLALCYVVPAVLHQGVGGALLEAAEEGARQAGLTELALESTRTAQAFYLRKGYVPAGAVQAWAGLQAQPMRKRL
jgi:GNAT superfamily N-acetyltransferase